MKSLRLIAIAAVVISTAACSPHNDVEGARNDGEMVISDKISNLDIYSIAEDSFGHIWFGTGRGLDRYSVNGYHQYYHYSDSLGLPSNVVNVVMCDSKKRIWAGTTTGAARAGQDASFIRVPTPNFSHNIRGIVESKDGGIFANGVAYIAKYQDDTSGFVQVVDSMLTYGGIQSLFATENNRLVAVCLTQVRVYDASSLRLTDSVATGHPAFFSTLCRNGDLWMSGVGNLSIYNVIYDKQVQIPEGIRENSLLMSSDIEAMLPVGEEGIILNTSRNGVFYYSRREDRVIRQDDPAFPFSLPDMKLNIFFIDSQGNLWTGSEGKGFHVSRRDNQFNANRNVTSHFEGKDVLAMAMDSEGNLWTGTKEDGVEVYNPKTKTFKNVDLEPYLTKVPIGTMECSAMAADEEGNIWMAFKSHFTVLKARMSDGNPHVTGQYQATYPTGIFIDEDGTVWTGSAGEYIQKLEKGSAAFENVDVLDPSRPEIGYTILNAIEDLGDGSLMFGNYFFKFRRYDKATGHVGYMPIPDSCYASAFGKWLITATAMKKDSFGDIWIGTSEKGLLRYSPDKRTLEKVPGAPCTDISSIEEDQQGNIWVSTLNGLGKYDRTVGRFSNYFEGDGIGCDQYNRRSSCILWDGSIVFGSCMGMTCIDPIVVPSKRSVPVVFENLTVHGKAVNPSPEGPIKTFLSARPDITLRHNQNEFSITYSALDYSEDERANFHYKLDGYNKYWVDAGHSNEAAFADIPAGRYVFRVRASNTSGSIEEVENSINVRVKPAPWMTWWAWCIYLACLAAVAYCFISLRRRYVREREATREAKMEKEQQEEMNRRNITFFANIAHEFRTPLTMIAGPVSLLEENKSSTAEDKRLLGIVRRSVSWMLQLVGQLMDAGKLSSGKLKTRVAQTDAVAVLKEIFGQFKVNADIKGVEFVDAIGGDSLMTWLDTDKYRKILNNLLSNAFKFTPSGGKVTLALDVVTREEAEKEFTLKEGDKATQYLKTTVSDTGKGIPEDQLEKIFDRYYQLDNQSRGIYNWGSGIGLSFSRALTELHHGYIKAGNVPVGTGAVFTLILPVDKEAYSDEEREPMDEGQKGTFPVVPDQVEESVEETSEESVQNESSKPVILVADDDVDIANYLKLILSKEYNVVLCFDGDSAMEKMDEVNPDLVISDVVMPGKSGFELCRMIKSSMQHSHVPVILVTAKVTTESQVEGLGEGADAYVTKPFDPNYLMALIKSILENRRKLQASLQKSTAADSIKEDEMLPQDRAFMNRLYSLMEEELDNPELDVSTMTDKMKISRTKFYYKVKGLTGENPSVFFKEYKLNRARDLIKEGKYNMSEIADMTGFSTLSHFSTSFKKQFGVPPSEYKG